MGGHSVVDLMLDNFPEVADRDEALALLTRVLGMGDVLEAASLREYLDEANLVDEARAHAKTDLRTMFLRDSDESHDTAAREIAAAETKVARMRALRPSMCTPEQLQRGVFAALYTLRRVWLDFYGVTCPCCRGDGETPADELPATMGSPSEITMSACTLCRGVGEVLLDEAAKWIDAELVRFGADDFYTSGLLDWLEETAHKWVELRDSERGGE